jgi:hypothetical protein
MMIHAYILMRSRRPKPARAAVRPVARIAACRRFGQQVIAYIARVQNVIVQSAQNDVASVAADNPVLIEKKQKWANARCTTSKTSAVRWGGERNRTAIPR